MRERRRTIALLAEERSFMEILGDRLGQRHGWECRITDTLDQTVKDADLIVADSRYGLQLKEQPELLSKTVLLVKEERKKEGEPTDASPALPGVVFKYGGFSRLEQVIGKAMDCSMLQGSQTARRVAPMVAMGAWDGSEAECLEAAKELARRLDGIVLFIGMQRFSEEDSEEGEEKRWNMERILYYALERLLDGERGAVHMVRSTMDVSQGVCRLPESSGMNPLWRLSEEQWDRLLPLLTEASCAKAILLWTGREEMTQCSVFTGRIGGCVYLRPEEERGGWERFCCWAEQQGAYITGAELCPVDSWMEAVGEMETVVRACEGI